VDTGRNGAKAGPVTGQHAAARLRHHASLPHPETLNPALVEAGFGIGSQYGDGQRGPLTGDSGEIITVSRAQ
jgi:hypothetical protein